MIAGDDIAIRYPTANGEGVRSANRVAQGGDTIASPEILATPGVQVSTDIRSVTGCVWVKFRIIAIFPFPLIFARIFDSAGWMG
jgi:hypothetical protein